MVAFLGGIVVLMMFALAGAWATIERKNDRIAELEALREPVEKRVPWHVEVVHADRSTLPEFWPAGDDDSHEPTKVCRLS